MNLTANPGDHDLIVRAEDGIRALLQLIGDDPDRDGLIDTPGRVVKAYREMAGRPGRVDQLLSVTFEEQHSDEMVVVGPVPFVSLCEHHLLPFAGQAWIGYLPQSSIVGLSKLPRLLDHFAKRPQVQERLTTQVTEALDQHLVPKGSACVIRATHACTTYRGVGKEAPMTTSSLTGAFRVDRTRNEFLALTHG